ncbi:inositol 1,4,5-trisphosphate receptor-interacting protein [Oryzias latipes]|uniref:Inositol 1,4,5-trisphosphate receptor-interacting protein n=1 Tax=Oryzias latipes TaxID=8090 RepID=H2LP19_ORYLA|nr:inositol 1,4,5-trisphosphate receptor-interacting protein [Oryzias latipes]
MQGAVARVFVVVAAAILNHPLLFPQENTTLPEQDEELMARMREHEEKLEMELAKLESEILELESKQEEGTSRDAYMWYFWSSVSFVIFFVIEMCRVELAETEIRNLEDEEDGGSITPRMMVLDKDILRNFCDKCSYSSAHENWKVREFVEGLADDLLESLRSVCDRDTDMEVGDFVGIGSMFESWKVCGPLVCDLMVPFSPPHPHFFQSQMWCSSDQIPLDMQGSGRIRATRFGENDEGCLCSAANMGDDMLCLLHSTADRQNAGPNPDELLCLKNTDILSKDQVMKWFQISVTKAWGRISHKYDFQVLFRNLDAAGALKVRFRSGKVILLNLIPVVQLEDTDAYFVSHFPSGWDSPPDPFWPLSLAVYERNLLKYFAKRLPQDSCHSHCLQIAAFLNRKQTELTGKSFLSSYHLKTVLLHVLLSTKTTAWRAGNMEHRLRDVLGLLHQSLLEKRLHHALVGNRKVPEVLQVPGVIRKAEPINLFRSLVLQRQLYAATVRHLQEILKNASIVIQEYVPRPSNNGFNLSLDEGFNC